MALKSYKSILLFAFLAGIAITSCKKEDEKVSFLLINDGVSIGPTSADFRALIFCAQKPPIKKLGFVLTDYTTGQTENYSLDSMVNSRDKIHIHINNLSTTTSYIYQFYAETAHEKIYSQRDSISLSKP